MDTNQNSEKQIQIAMDVKGEKMNDPVPTEPRERSASTWTTRSTVMAINRPIYHTRTVREKYLKPDDSPKSWKEKITQRFKKDNLSSHLKPEKVKKCATSLFPCVGIMRKYNWKTDLPNDIVAGLTVGIMQLPQGMAYAMLADLPPVVGLYVSFFPVIIYFFFGTSKQVSMGTVAVISLMVGSVVSSQVTQWRKEHGVLIEKDRLNISESLIEQERIFKIEIGASVAFITGLCQIGMGLCRFGFVTTYMGDSLVSGFTTGAAMHVFTSQIKTVLGISIPRYPNLLNLIYTYIAIFKGIPKTNIATFVFAVVCMIILYVVKVQINDRFKSKLKMPIPVELIVVVASTLICHYAELNKRWGIKVVGAIPAGLPSPQFPTFENVNDYGVDCIIIAVVAFAQSVSLAVIMAKKHHYDIDSNKELIGYGTGTLFGSFFSCYPMAGSVSRSSVQDSAGGKTQLASLFSASLVLIVILFIGPLFENLPSCALSAIIIVALKSMFMQVLDVKVFYKTSKMDCLIWLVTFACVIILNVDMGLVAGIGFACFTVVIRSQMAKVTRLEKLKDLDEYRPQSKYTKTEPSPNICIVSYNAPLYYANSELFMSNIYKETGVKPEKMRKTEPSPNICIVSYNAPLYYANSELFMSNIYKETGVKPEKMRKVLKKLLLGKDSDKQNKKTFPDSKIVEIETVTCQTSLSNGDTQVPNGHQQGSTTIGPSPNSDPRPFLYLIIDCSHLSFIDPVGVKSLKQIIEDYKTVGITTYLGGVKDEAWLIMESTGFISKYEKVIFLTVGDAVLAAEEDKLKKSHPLPGFEVCLIPSDNMKSTMPLLQQAHGDMETELSNENGHQWTKTEQI